MIARVILSLAMFVAVRAAWTQETQHVAPDPPEHVMHDMNYKEMVRVMEMDDRTPAWRIMIEQLEWQGSSEHAVVWDGNAWYGDDYNKFLLRAEGKRLRDETEEARTEFLWDRIIARRWSTQLGLRQDVGIGPSRTWGGIGLQGLAPYWFEIEAMLYIGEENNTAARIRAEYDLRLTQRWILQPKIEANLYGKADPQWLRGKGLSDMHVGLRLRYEFRREIALYVGANYEQRFGDAADFAQAARLEENELSAVVGVRFWF